MSDYTQIFLCLVKIMNNNPLSTYPDSIIISEWIIKILERRITRRLRSRLMEEQISDITLSPTSNKTAQVI